MRPCGPYPTCLSLYLLYLFPCLCPSLPELYPCSHLASTCTSSASCFRYNACLIFPGLPPVSDYLIFLVPAICFFGAYLSTVAGMGAWPVDSGNLLANHAHRHRDSLKWRVCLCRPGDAYASVLSAYCLAYHPALSFLAP